MNVSRFRPLAQGRASQFRPVGICRSFAGAVLLTGAGLIFSVASARADTDHVREFAKNSTPILIVVSGPEAEPIGRRLEQAIERSGDFKNRSRSSVQVVTATGVDQALASKQFSRCSIVFLISGSDAGAATLSPTVTGLIPLKPEVIGSRLTMVRSGKDGADPGSPEFRVGLYAPDAERLQRIYDVFVQHRVKNFRELPFVEAYRTNRIFVHSSPEFQPLLTSGWGQMNDPHIWNDVRWSPMDDRSGMSPTAVPEGTRVYFVDRKSLPTLPPDVLSSLNGQAGRETALLAIHTNSTSNAPRPPSLGSAQAIGLDDQYVIYSPSRQLLETRIRNHPTVFSLNRLPVAQDTVDLRHVSSTSILIPMQGVPINENQSATISDLASSDTRERLGIAVEARGASIDQRSQEIELSRLESRGAGGQPGRPHFRSRYTWVFKIGPAVGNTVYASNARCLTPDMPEPYGVDEPQEPKRKNRNESDDDFARRHGDWQDQHDRWLRAGDDYRSRYRTESCDWELTVAKQEHAAVHGTLQLWDFENPAGARILWQQDCDGEATTESNFRRGRVVVVGHGNKPRPLDTPPPSSTCGEGLITNAARGAFDDGLAGFTEVALLPRGGEIAEAQPIAPPVTASTNDPGQVNPPVSAQALSQFAGKIADIDGSTITLTIGNAEGVGVGDYFSIALKTREIKDPDTGEVKDVRVVDSVLVRVTRTGATADCVLASNKDTGRFSLIQVGMPISKARRPLNP